MNRVGVMVIGALLAGLIALSGCERSSESPQLQHALLAGSADTLPDFRLRTQYGEPFTNADLIGRWTLLFSGFTHCPDICPATLGVLRAAQSRIAPRDDLQTVFVTVDPARDSPPALAEYLAGFDESWIGLTGTPQELNRLLDSLQMAYVRVPTSGGEYAMDHASAVALINRHGQLIAWWRAPIKVAALADDLRRLPIQ